MATETATVQNRRAAYGVLQFRNYSFGKNNDLEDYKDPKELKMVWPETDDGSPDEIGRPSVDCDKIWEVTKVVKGGSKNLILEDIFGKDPMREIVARKKHQTEDNGDNDMDDNDENVEYELQTPKEVALWNLVVAAYAATGTLQTLRRDQYFEEDAILPENRNKKAIDEYATAYFVELVNLDRIEKAAVDLFDKPIGDKKFFIGYPEDEWWGFLSAVKDREIKETAAAFFIASTEPLETACHLSDFFKVWVFPWISLETDKNKKLVWPREYSHYGQFASGKSWLWNYDNEFGGGT